jgi:hypothetical protein
MPVVKTERTGFKQKRKSNIKTLQQWYSITRIIAGQEH